MTEKGRPEDAIEKTRRLLGGIDPSMSRGREPGEKVARVRLGTYEFKKKGVSRFDLRDPYHLAVALRWPQFLTALLALYLVVNVGFATLFWLVPGSVANARQGSFADKPARSATDRCS